MRAPHPILVLLLLALASSAAAAPEMKSDDDKTVYTMGYSLARNLQIFGLDERELEILMSGLADGVAGKEPPFDVDTYAPKVGELQRARMTAAAEREKTAGAEFVAAAAQEPGAKVTDSGLVYREVTAGTGESPKRLDVVKVHYHGTLRDGTVFDSSVERGVPATFPLNRVIRCWTEALQLMKVGGKSVITCPNDLAYGARAQGKIPAGAALQFEVELLDIEQ